MNKEIYELIFYGRGGMGVVTAAEMLCDIAYKDGFKDVLSIPIIGAERRGAPIKVFVKLSPEMEIKNYSAVKAPDITMVFDTSLLKLPGVLDPIKKGIVLINTHEKIDKNMFPEGVKIFTVDATGISIKNNLLVSGNPVLNVPMIGAYAKILGHITLESIKAVLEERFPSKAEKNFETAKFAYESVKEL